MKELEMRNMPNKIFYLFLTISWIFSGFFFFVFLKNSGWLPNTPTTIYEITYLIVFLVFFILPFISHIKLGKVEVGLNIAEESELKEKPKTIAELKGRIKTKLEIKILNTLWKRQLLKYPELNGSWAFRLNFVAPEYHEFRESCNRLIGEGLIRETSNGLFTLTIEGLKYCSEHYKNFPDEMWFEDKPIPEGNLKKLLNKLKEIK